MFVFMFSKHRTIYRVQQNSRNVQKKRGAMTIVENKLDKYANIPQNPMKRLAA